MDVIDHIKKEGMRRGLSHRTIKTYCQCVARFLYFCRKDPKYITKKDIRDYMDLLVRQQRAGNTLNVYLSALKFLFEEILCKRLLLYMKYSKVPKTLPTVLTQQEVQHLFQAIPNKTHSLLTRFLYATGLRVSELTHLKIIDLDFSQNYGWVRKGKGNKDRMFLIAEKLAQELQEHIANASLLSRNFLFPGRYGQPLSTRTVYAIIKTAAQRAGIMKNVHPHTLRHSYATHLIEHGYALADLQTLLGHASMETTSRYVHMASPSLIKTKSPYDLL